MAKLSSRPLRSNPFHTYRDPETGKWLVVESASSETQYYPPVNPLSSGASLKQEIFPKIALRIQNPESRIQAMADS